MNPTIAARVRPDQVEALRALRAYLARIDFVAFYRHAVTPARYAEDPHVASAAHGWHDPAALARRVGGAMAGRHLAIALIVPAPVAMDALTAGERGVAAQLVAAGLLDEDGGGGDGGDGGVVAMGEHQLVSAAELPLLVDARVNHPDRGAFAVYLGRDSWRLAAWAGARPPRQGSCLDLGTGCGLAGLAMSRHGAPAILTDVSEEALRLAAMNAILAGAEDRITLRHEASEATLAGDERHARVSFNPPYLAVPDELTAPAYARGAGDDGLDLGRRFAERLVHVLAPHGVAFLVAELPGDDRGPFFSDELRARAGATGLAAELFVEARRPLAADDACFRALGGFLHRWNPTRDAAACQRLVEARYLETLGASWSYAATLRFHLA